MATVNLRDRLFSDTGGVVQNATAQAILVTGGGTDAGVSSVVQATTTTDVNGVWKFTGLPDPGAGNWYDVKLTNGNQVRWRYGNIQAAIQALQLATSYTVPAGQSWDFSSAATVKGIPAVNLLVNPGLEIWQRGTGFGTANAYTADGWQMIVAGTDVWSVSKDTTHVDVGSNACAFLSFTLGTGAGGSGLVQIVKMSEQALQGKTVTVSARVSTTLANAIRLNVSSDGTGGSGGGSSAHPGDGVYHTLTATAVVATNATQLNIALNLSAGGPSQAFYVDNVTLVEGAVPMDYLPLAVADEMSRCWRRYQRWTRDASAYLPTSGAGTSTTTAFLFLPLRVAMGGSLTLSLSSVAHWGLVNSSFAAAFACTGLILFQLFGEGPMLQGTIGSASLTAGSPAWLQSNTAGAWLAVEWNP